MKKGIYREKSMQHISSPEQLNDYVRVTNPGVWIVLSAIIILLIGVCVWSFFGKIETSVDTVLYSNGADCYCYFSEADIADVAVGMAIKAENAEGTLTALSDLPMKVDTLSEYIAHVGGFEADEWVYGGLVDIPLPSGIYEGSIKTGSFAVFSLSI